MAGIYIHIPFCRKVCYYCDFHFSVSLRNKEDLLDCIIMEIDLQSEYPDGEEIETIYFGGGTPSMLSSAEINTFIEKIYSTFNVSENCEITLEANPDDLNIDYLKKIKKIGINRLSIGVQSFYDEDLVWMNRRHTGKQAFLSIKNSIDKGFENINIDLIYGLPGMSIGKWRENLEIAFDLKITHLSAYHLTLEEKTVYAFRVKKGLMDEPDEVGGSRQFELLMNMAEINGFIHYEISNLALPGFISRHNTSYWSQKKYLGIGPSANSFNGFSRQWNVANNSEYIQSIKNGIIPFSYEKLEVKDMYNEYLLTSLRTIWGVNPEIIERRFGKKFLEHFNRGKQYLITEGKLEENGDTVIIPSSAKFFSDGIISSLFWS